MKKLSKILALALAVAMMLGMTAMAGTTLYYAQDFNYADFDAFAADVYLGGATVKTYTPSAVAVETARTNGKNMMTVSTGFTDWAANGYDWDIENTNVNGNVMLNSEANGNSIHFIPTNSWTANANEKYVISFELTSDIAPWTNANTPTHYALHVIGNNGTAETPNYQTGVIGQLLPQGDYGYVTANYSSPEVAKVQYSEAFAANTPKRLVYIFEQNPEGGLLRSGAVDGTSWYEGSVYNLGDMKSVDGLSYLIGGTYPSISDIKMYTIGKSDAFAVTSNVGEVVDPSTKKVTLTFTQPVYEAGFDKNSITVTANGKNLSGVTFGDLKTTGTVGGSYTSSIDVNLPALAMSTDYVITVSGVKNELGEILSDNTVSFSTPKADVSFVAYEGLAEGGATLKESEYAGKTVYVKATAINNNAITMGGKLIIGIYENGNLVKYASTTKSLAASGEATFGAAFKLAAGQTIVAEYK